MRLKTLMLLMILCAFARPARATNSIAITAEGVNDYSYNFAGSHAYDIYGADDALNFSSNMPTSIFPSGSRTIWTNSNVWDKDFIDASRLAAGADDFGFDQPGVAVSFFAGHGICPVSLAPTGWCPAQLDANCPCSYTSQCPSGMQCQVNPAGNGTCHYNNDAAIVTASSSDVNSHRAYYGPTTGRQNIALGEGAYPRNWAGVGTGGGTNLAIFFTSCGAMPNYFWANQKPIFASVHALFTNLVVYGDTAAAASFGASLATIAAANVNAAVSQAWFDAMGITTAGAACPGNGGWGGYLGCGANLAVSYAESYSWANYHVASETWTNVRDDNSDAFGNAAAAGYLRCNYDCNTYPMTR